MNERELLLAVVIPTRNRASLAITACESLVNQNGCRYQVFLSDNCTSLDDSARLAEYCASTSGRVTYLKPESPLPMATHWDWALRTAMATSDATHFNVHYDRRITKPGHLAFVQDVMTAFPDELITWTYDVVDAQRGRSIVWQTPWDGRLYKVPTARVVAMTVTGRITEMAQAFPILSNCAVPRAVLSALVGRFGSICNSTAPDSSFTYRFCATFDGYLHLDRAIGLIHAFDRSTGSGFMRGAGGDFPDFMQWWGSRPWLDAAPIPGLNLGQNVLFHEYEVVRRATNHPAFQPVELPGYLRELASSLWYVEDPARREELRKTLEHHGWRSSGEPDERKTIGERPSWLRQAIVKTFDNASAWIFGDRMKARDVRTAVRKFLVNRLHIAPADICGFEYATDAEAVSQALRLPRRRSTMNPFLTWLKGVEVLPTAAPGSI